MGPNVSKLLGILVLLCAFLVLCKRFVASVCNLEKWLHSHVNGEPINICRYDVCLFFSFSFIKIQKKTLNGIFILLEGCHFHGKLTPRKSVFYPQARTSVSYYILLQALSGMLISRRKDSKVRNSCEKQHRRGISDIINSIFLY